MVATRAGPYVFLGLAFVVTAEDVDVLRAADDVTSPREAAA